MALPVFYHPQVLWADFKKNYGNFWHLLEVDNPNLGKREGGLDSSNTTACDLLIKQTSPPNIPLFKAQSLRQYVSEMPTVHKLD